MAMDWQVMGKRILIGVALIACFPVSSIFFFLIALVLIF